VLELALHVDGDAGCNTGKLVIARHDRIGVDEQAAIATTDSVETKLVGWTAAGEGGDALWSRAGDATGNHVLLGSEATFETDVQLVSPVLQASATQPLVVTLQHAYKLDATQFPGVFFDGGVIELTDDGGATWRDVRELGADPIYPGIISIDFINALAGRKVFGGTSAAYPQRVPLALDFGTQFAGQPVQLRFRLGTDSCCAPSGPPAPVPSGWQLDDIAITGITNTPFPGFVAEPTKCVAAASGLADSADSAVLAVRRMPRRSLAGVR